MKDFLSSVVNSSFFWNIFTLLLTIFWESGSYFGLFMVYCFPELGVPTFTVYLDLEISSEDGSV